MRLKEQVGFFVLSHLGHTQCELHRRLRRDVATEMHATEMDLGARHNSSLPHKCGVP